MNNKLTVTRLTIDEGAKAILTSICIVNDVTESEAVEMLAYDSILFNDIDRDLISIAAEKKGVSFGDFVLGAVLNQAHKIINSKAVFSGRLSADQRIEFFVAEIMERNELASNWMDKNEITRRFIFNHISPQANMENIKSYWRIHQNEIADHHRSVGISADHNRRVSNENRKRR